METQLNENKIKYQTSQYKIIEEKSNQELYLFLQQKLVIHSNINLL